MHIHQRCKGLVTCVACATMIGSVRTFADPLPVHELVFTEAVAGDFSGLPAQSDPRFGASVAMDGGWLAVGAPYTIADGSQGGTPENGAVFLFHFENGGWQFQDRLIVTGLLSSKCGLSLAMALPWLVMGCPDADDDPPPKPPFTEVPEGWVYLYRLDSSSGDWAAYDSWSGSETDGGCGVAVDVVNGTGEDATLAYACIGATGGPIPVETRHVALVDYDPDNGIWSQTQILTPSGAGFFSGYGSELDLYPEGRVGDPSRLLVSAPVLGWVYVYEKQSQWVEMDVVEGDTPSYGAYFGTSLALSGDDLWIGAPRAITSHANCQSSSGCGRVDRYLSTGSQTTLEEFAQVVSGDNVGGNPPGPQAEMRFGSALALSTPDSMPDGLCSGDVVAVGAPMTDGPSTHSGYVALRAARDIDGLAGRCGELRIPSNLLGGSTDFKFGSALDFGSEYRLAVGVPGHKGFLEPRTGRVWIYRRDRIFMDGFD